MFGLKQPLKSVSLVDLNQTEKVTEQFVQRVMVMSDYLCQYSGCDLEVECWVTLAPWAGDMATGPGGFKGNTSQLSFK